MEMDHFKDNTILSDFILYSNKNFSLKKKTMKILENLSEINKERIVLKDSNNDQKEEKDEKDEKNNKKDKKKTTIGKVDDVKQLSLIKEDSFEENLELNEKKNELEISIVGKEKLETKKKNVFEIENLIKKCDEDMANIDKIIKKYQYSSKDLIMQSQIIDDKSMIFIDKKGGEENEDNDDVEKKTEYFKEIKNEFCVLKRKLENLLSMYKSEKELTEVTASRDAMKLQWQNEKADIDKTRKLKEQLEQAHFEEEKYTREGDYNKAAELKYGTIPSLEKQLEASQKADDERHQAEDNGLSKSLLRQEVTEEDIARVVSVWTGIPVSKMMAGEKQKYVRLETVLHERVIGQDEAVKVVSDAIRRNRAGLSDPDKPLGSFMFIGPTGVGKTELAKTLADFLFNDEKALTRIDMSEYMEKFSVTRLIGAPPGYVGYDEGGQLTEAVRHRPYSVILFDEIEKAHPDVFNVLLQVLDDGRLTDGQGRTVDFKNTIIIMTSNLGSNLILEKSEENLAELKNQIDELLKNTFRPEFLNRIDEIVMFNKLKKDAIGKIVELQLSRIAKRLEERRISINFDEKAVAFIGKKGYDSDFGARPVKRAVQNYVENPLAKMLLEGKFDQDSKISVSADDNTLIFV